MTDAVQPDVSVVIPMRDRGGVRLDNCLRSLRWQDLHPARVDIVISDFKLGERDRGTDAIERIRMRFGRHVPAIVLTGDTSQIPAKLSEQPATRMLNKPVDVQLLVATMDQLLRSQ